MTRELQVSTRTSWYVPSFNVILTTIERPKLTLPFGSSSTYAY